MEKTQLTVKDLTKVIKFSAFAELYCNVNARGGLYHRVNGYGTNKGDKISGLTENDKKIIREGLVKLVSEIDQVVDSLKPEEDDQV